MKLLLDDTQRLNLHALMGAQRGSLDDIRFFWKLQDRINLTEEERQAIHFQIKDVNGMQQATWDLSPQQPVEYEFSSEEVSRLAKMLKEWQMGFLATDRRWLEPLLAQVDSASASTNGNK